MESSFSSKPIPEILAKVLDKEKLNPKPSSLVDKAWYGDEKRILDEAISFNQNRFYYEFTEDKIGKVELAKPLDELIAEIKDVKQLEGDEKIIRNAIEINSKIYNLKIRFLKGEIILGVIGEEGERFDTSRAEGTNICGWVAQGDYSFGNYLHPEHWGVAVSSEMKGTALADFLYNLKCFVDEQERFEHVNGSDYPFLTFYIKKGYVPHSVIIPPDMKEYILSEEEKNSFFNHLISQRNSNRENNNLEIRGSISYAFKLKLDPKNAVKIYNKIRKSIWF